MLGLGSVARVDHGRRVVRDVSILASLALAGLGVLAAPALATFHLNKVNEVMLASSSGDSGVQFVELLDRGGAEEQFTPVFAPYKLVVYDGGGTKLGEQMLNPAGLRGAAAVGREYLISTPAADAAFGVTGDERLGVSLPSGAGQACFEANTPSPTAFNCLTWGSITRPVPTNSMGTGSANGPVPPNGESDQRQADDSIVAASPTPKAPNTAKAPGGSSPTPPPAFAGIRFSARTAKVDRSGRALVRLRCPGGTNGSCRGRLFLSATHGRVTFGRATFNIASSKTVTVKVKLSRAALGRLSRAGRLSVRARAQARDAAATSTSTSSRLTLVPGSRQRSRLVAR
jgi:hypothetical protein